MKTVRNVSTGTFARSTATRARSRRAGRRARRSLHAPPVVQKTIREKPDPVHRPRSATRSSTSTGGSVRHWYPLVYCAVFDGRAPERDRGASDRRRRSRARHGVDHEEPRRAGWRRRRRPRIAPRDPAPAERARRAPRGATSAERRRRHVLLSQPRRRAGDDDVVAEEELVPGAQRSSGSGAGSSTPRGTRSSRGRSRRA